MHRRRCPRDALISFSLPRFAGDEHYPVGADQRDRRGEQRQCGRGEAGTDPNASAVDAGDDRDGGSGRRGEQAGQGEQGEGKAGLEQRSRLEPDERERAEPFRRKQHDREHGHRRLPGDVHRDGQEEDSR